MSSAYLLNVIPPNVFPEDKISTWMGTGIQFNPQQRVSSLSLILAWNFPLATTGPVMHEAIATGKGGGIHSSERGGLESWTSALGDVLGICSCNFSNPWPGQVTPSLASRCSYKNFWALVTVYLPPHIPTQPHPWPHTRTNLLNIRSQGAPLCIHTWPRSFSCTHLPLLISDPLTLSLHLLAPLILQSSVVSFCSSKKLQVTPRGSAMCPCHAPDYRAEGLLS